MFLAFSTMNAACREFNPTLWKRACRGGVLDGVRMIGAAYGIAVPPGCGSGVVWMIARAIEDSGYRSLIDREAS